MSDKVAEIKEFLTQEDEAAWVTNMWDTYNKQRAPKKEEWSELRNYVFATDTTTTSNSGLPWKNSTTLPKLCQIRDNLHSNYLSALLPNDDWLKWMGYSSDDETREKREAVEAYMKNKTREGNIRGVLSQLLYDYIDYGNAFAMPSFKSEYKILESEEKVAGFVGPVLRRISPLDIVFNPLADDFRGSWKIIRAIKTVGEIRKMIEEEPDAKEWERALKARFDMSMRMGAYTTEDFEKAQAYSVDGFGNLHEYYGSQYVEILEFYGDYYDRANDKLYKDRVITVMDRSHVVRVQDIPSWLGHAPIYHAGWRNRPDNLWAMGPLDNLVGMQYRIDHLENIKADAMDLAIHPPLVIQGEVEEFNWGPSAEIHIDENGGVQELGKNLGPIIAAENQIQALEERMELYAGAPREAMGVRSPGEKTAFEIQALENASGRIFQEKIVSFEINLVEPSLNGMLEEGRRNLDTFDVVRTLDPDMGIETFLEITKEDITARGKIRPVGARHFAKQAQLLQNLAGIANSPLYQTVAPHVSGKAMSTMLEDVLGLQRFQLFQPNIAVTEQQETQRLANRAAEDLEVEATNPLPEDIG